MHGQNLGLRGWERSHTVAWMCAVSTASASSGLSLRGTIEGFYGPPWSHEQRLAHLDFSARVGLNCFVYAPKDDPYHRERWREPYPAQQLAQLAELAARARALDVAFTYAIHPALSMRYADASDHAALAAKAGQLLEIGISSFGLLFDDVPYDLPDAADRALFGSGPVGSGAAHGETCTRFVEEVLRPRGVDEPLLVCPTDYAGLGSSPYREQLARTAPPDAVIAWTGRDVVSASVTRAEIDQAARCFARRIVLWDNFPVNDFESSRLFLGPLTDRPDDLEDSALVGVIANPMPLAEASRFALASVAEWAADPAGYDRAPAAIRAGRRVAGRGITELAPLVRACSGWPPDSPEDPGLEALARAALADDVEALEVLEQRLTELAESSRAATTPSSLVAELRPWLESAVDMCGAGLSAARLLEASLAGAGDLTRLREETRVSLDAAERHYPNVLRRTIPPFVRAVLDRTAPPPPALESDPRPRARLVSGSAPDAADRATAELLEELGFVVTDQAPSLIVVSGTAPSEAVSEVARLPVPVVTWRGARQLGMARAQKGVMVQDRLTVVDPDDPTAAGHDGEVVVHRGWAWMIVADVDDEHVVARAGSDGWACLYHYAAADTLADGGTAPAARVGVPLGENGPARWLVTPAGREILGAAVRFAMTGSPPRR